MSADEDSVDRDTMIATLEELGNTYIKSRQFEDAEHVFGIILQTGREKFTSAFTFHDTMYRASIVMQRLKIDMKDSNEARKYDQLAKYHQNASTDAIKIESMCKKVQRQDSDYSDS